MVFYCHIFSTRSVLGTLASSLPLLSSKSVHLICYFASGISKIGFISRINSLKDITSLDADDSDMYSASVVDKAIAVCKRLNHVIGQPVYFNMYLLSIDQYA